VDCASCHDLSGFARATYSVADHRHSDYPLEGAHARAECEGCHTKAKVGPPAASLGTARVVMRPAHAACVDCHIDPHGGRFSTASAPRGARRPVSRAMGECTSCHSIEAFRPASVDAFAHSRYAFPLEGAHRAVPCEACHASLRHPPTKTLRGAAGAASLRLAFDDATLECASCHKSPHGDQFAHRRDQGACQGCHGSDVFVPADRFDHGRDTQFTLEGAHQRTPCASCHVPAANPNAVPRVRYRPTPSRCVDCHDSGTSGDRKTGLRAPGVPLAPPIMLTSREGLHVTH
jgi:hypothetical protein